MRLSIRKGPLFAHATASLETSLIHCTPYPEASSYYYHLLLHLEEGETMSKKFFFLCFILSIVAMPAFGFAQCCSLEIDAKNLLSSFVAYTDLRINSVQQSLEILAATTEARSGKWENIKGLLSGYQKSDSGLIVWYARPDGTYYTVDKGLMDVKLNDRSYFPDSNFPDIVAGRNVIGTLVVSGSTGQRSAVIAIPVKEGGKIVGAVGASLLLDRLSEQIDSTFILPPDAAFFALAPNGLTTLHRKKDRHFLDPRKLGSETLKKTANEMLANNSGEITYEFDNATKVAIYRTSPLTQWKFAITVSVTPE